MKNRNKTNMKVSSAVNRDGLKVIKRKFIVMLVAMGVFVAAILVFRSTAWFTSNKDVSGNGMQMTAGDMLFELKTSGSSGLYDEYFEKFDSEYQHGTETAGANQKLIWQLSSGSNMNNYWGGENAPTEDELNNIKRIESFDYGLSPGDYGQIKFTIVPRDKTQTFSVQIHPEMTCFRVDYYTTDDNNQGHLAGDQNDDTFARMESDKEEDKEALKFISGHLLYFYEADTDGNGTNEMHLMGKDGFLIENITDNTDVIIHWVWPESLSNIINEEVEGLDTAGASALKHYFFENPDIFLKKAENDNFSNITIGADATSEEVNAKSAIITADRLIYSSYRRKYNDADQIIGSNIGYIFLEMSVDVAK